jgi:hypothetical protein
VTSRFSRAPIRDLLIFALLMAAAVTLQWLAGAYSSELSGYPDEPSHYVTGLMIRDYIASGFGTTPLQFAESFYIHYPKVAFGIWGPLLPAIEAVWMLLLSPSRASVLFLMALITALLAFTLARVVGREFGPYAGVGSGLLLISLPVVQFNACMTMADNLCALMQVWALLCFGRYLDSQRRRDAVWFGLFACLSILTKINGVALVLLPPLALILTRRFALVKSRNFWIPAVMVLVIAGPWQYFSFRLVNGIGERHVSWSIASAYFPMMLRILGPWLLPFALVGFYDRVIRPFRSRKVEGRWAAAAAMVAAFWIFHALTPSAAAETRYTVAVVAPILMFFVAGVAWVAALVPPRRLPFPVRAGVLALGAACVFAATTFTIPRKLSYGFSELAGDLVHRPDLRDTVWLVSSEAEGEGMLIAEVAMRERRPGHILLRASKMLAVSDWDGARYRSLFPTPEAILAYLEGVPARLLIVDRTPGRYPSPHHAILLKMLAKYPDHWKLIGTYPRAVPVTAPHSRIEVYRLLTQENRPVGAIEINLKYTLGRTIRK